MNEAELQAAQEAYSRGDILEIPKAPDLGPAAPEANPVTGKEPEAEVPPTDNESAGARTAVEPENESPAEDKLRDDEGRFAKADDKRSEPRVPKSRLDEALRRGDELQARLAELEQQRSERLAADTSATKLDELEEKYMEAVQEGDTARAKEVRSQIRAVEREQYQSELTHERSVNASQAELQRIVAETVGAIEASYPEMNPDAPEYSQELSQAAFALMQGFMASGQYSQVAAMREAARITAMQHGLQDRSAPAAPQAPAKPDPNAERTKQAVAKNAAAAAKQPPAQTSGVSSDALGGALTAEIAAKMSTKEFDALTEAQKAAIRGDVI